MEVFIQRSVAGFANCYVIGSADGSDAIIIDPGMMDVQLLRTIEDHRYTLSGVLITHGHTSHVDGLKTLRKIYDADIYANADEVLGFPCQRIQDGVALTLGSTSVIPLAVSGHSTDSVVFQIDRMLFTGDTLSAGVVGSTPNAFARALLIDAIKERLCSLAGDYLIFPGHGAPSTLEVERRTNPSLAAT